MKRGGGRQVWFDILAYVLMSLFIILFILEIIWSSWERMLFFLALLLVVCAALIVICLRQRRTVRQYRELTEWMKRGSPEDTDSLPGPLREDMENFLSALESRYSYESLKTNMEYAALQNQINPHFLYNTLDAIRSQALAAGEREIADMTGKLSRFYRYSVKNGVDLVPLGEELGNVEDYFSIQQYRFEDRFSLDILSGDPDILNYYIPKMTLQPIVENALYHGLEVKPGKGRITVRLTLLEKSLHIVISDNGRGMSEQELLKVRERLRGKQPEEDPGGKRTGIALYNVNRRLKILFGEAYGLQVASVPDVGTDVEIRIPLVDEENRGLLTAGLAR